MALLTVVGLGPGAPELLTREAENILSRAGELYVRTRHHPTLTELSLQGTIRSFDSEYRRAASLDQVYERIADRLLSLAEKRPVIYAVPGDPMVGERSVRLATERAAARSIEVRIVHGVSFLEPTAAAVGLDPIAGGLQIVDAGDLVHSHFSGAGRNPFAPRTRLVDPTIPALIAQIDSSKVAADVKLALLEWLPPEHIVVLVTGGATPPRAARVPLGALDRQTPDHLSTLYVPPIEVLDDLAAFETLRHITARLRGPDGCPWDREQTHETLKSTIVEEAYEVVEAIDRGLASGDWSDLSEELGDLLLNILLQAQIAAEAGEFWLEDVLRGVNGKLIRRHPHVFGDVAASTAEEVVRNWEQIKRLEKPTGVASRLGQVPASLPALSRAQTLQRRAARAGFAWPDVGGAWTKLEEELAELRDADQPEGRTEEIGDVLWMVAVIAGYVGIDAEDALRGTIAKFVRRFQEMERLAAEAGQDFAALGVERQLELYRRARQLEGGRT